MPSLALVPKSLFTFTTAVVGAAALLCAWRARAQAQPRTLPLAAAELTGPFVHDNLAVFLIHDKGARGDEDVVTLEEALKTGAVVIEETGQVHELVASNKGDRPVYLQAGDVVKGGRQDRTLQRDVMLPAGTKRMPLAAFCVESGRWQARGTEPSRHFSSSGKTLVTRKQKLAAKVAGDQGEVWKEVEEAQNKLATKMGRSVKAGASASSLQLSLEDGAVEKTADGYVRAIEAQLPRRDDVVGYAFAVNGEVSAVDVYASPALFRKMRGKLLKASAVEAVAEKTEAPTPAVKGEAVRALMTEAESGAERTEARGPRANVLRKETDKSVVFTTEDPAENRRSVHKNYLRK
jgi:hypothetical protein